MSNPVRARAQRVFADFLESGTPGGFDDLCRQHPDLAERLRVLYRTWRRMEDALASSPGDAVHHRGPPGPELPQEPTPPLPLPGGVVESPASPRYRAVREIACGGMGRISAVFDRELGRTVAKKTLLDDTPSGPGPRRLGRFLDEARITAQLNHPGIVPVHDIGLDADGRPFFTMPLVRGRSLAEAFAASRRGDPAWDRSRLLAVLIQVCEAVAYAHHRGVVHRDLKPTNVLVGEFGEVYVIDWGLATVLDRVAHDEGEAVTALRQRAGAADASTDPLRTHDGDVLGTPAYMSPEQATGAASRVGPASDVYSIGAMLHELLGGHPPYAKSTSADEALRRLRAGPPDWTGSGPPALCAIRERAMARDVEERYPTAAALRDELTSFRDQRVVQAYRTGAWAELSSWVRRNRALAAAMLLAVLSLGTGLVLTDAERRRANRQAVAATRGFETAAESVERMLTRVGIGLLQDTPRATALREQLLADAMDLQERLLALRPDDATVRRRVARSWNHVAHVHSLTGDKRTALDLYGRAADTVRALFERPAPRTWQQQDELAWETILWIDLATHESARAAQWMVVGHEARGLEALDALRGGLLRAAEHDDAPALCRRVAEFLTSRADLLERLDRADEADAERRTALELYADLDARDALLAYDRGEYAEALCTRAGALQARGDVDAAEACFARAHAVLAAAPDGDDGPWIREARQKVLRRRAAFLQQQDDSDGALRELTRAAAIAETLARDFPDEYRHWIALGQILGRAGQLHLANGDRSGHTMLERALSACERALGQAPENRVANTIYGQIQADLFHRAWKRGDWDELATLAAARARLPEGAEARLGGATHLARIFRAMRTHLASGRLKTAPYSTSRIARLEQLLVTVGREEQQRVDAEGDTTPRARGWADKVRRTLASPEWAPYRDAVGLAGDDATPDRVRESSGR